MHLKRIAPALAAMSFAAFALAGPCTGDAKTTEAKADKAGCAAVCPLTGQATAQTVAFTGDGADKAACAEKAEACAAKAECTDMAKADCEKACDKADVSFAKFIPAMGYKVGNEKSCCPKMAGEMAQENGGQVHFVVDGREYNNRAEAIVAHQKQLQGYLLELTRVQYAVDGECVPCPDAAKACDSKKVQYKVGPALFDSAEEAVRASVMAWNAAQQVKAEYAVAGEKTACVKTAGAMAEKANCSVEYVVNGKKTNCNVEANYLETMARVESALKAVEQVKGQA